MDWYFDELYVEEQSEDNDSDSYSDESSRVHYNYDEYDDNDADNENTDETFDVIRKRSDNLNHDDLENASPISDDDDENNLFDLIDTSGAGAELFSWDENDSSCNPENDSKCYNRPGVFYIKLLYAMKLPCPIGSSVGATISLPPFKGKVKSTRAKAVLGESSDHGVCVMWDQEQHQTDKNDGNEDGSNDDEYIEHVNYDDKNLLSMVNAWNSPDSPVPSIQIDLTFSPLGLAVFDFTMASIDISPVALLKNAGVWRTRWCPMKLSSPSLSQSTDHHKHIHDPILRIQALFIPSTSSEHQLETTKHTAKSLKGATKPQHIKAVPSKQPLQTHIGKTLVIENKDDVTNFSGDHDNSQLALESDPKTTAVLDVIGGEEKEEAIENQHINENIPQPLKNKENSSSFWDPRELSLMRYDTSVNEDTSIDGSRRTTGSRKSSRAAIALHTPHLLRAQTYWTPARCAVCSKLLMGMFRNGGGFQCEVCRIDCCSDCRLHVDLRVPCGSDLAAGIVEASFRKKMSPSSLLSYMAPDEAYEEKRHSMLDQETFTHPLTNTNSTSKQSLAMTTYTSTAPTAGSKSNSPEGIGRCRFEILTAVLFMQSTSTWNDSTEENEKQALRKGDYYVRVSISDSNGSARTPTLQKTGGNPNFRSAEMRFSVLHYGVEFRIDVVEADTDAIVGSTFLTAQGILQEQRDAYIAANGVSLLQFLKGPIPSMSMRQVRLKLRSGIKTGATADDFYSFPQKGSSGKEMGLFSGWIEITVGMEEYYSRLYGPHPIACPDRPPADLNVANFSNYIGRVKAIVDDFKHAIDQYQYIVSWQNPLLTATTLYIFIWTCLRFNVEYIGCLPILLAISFLVYCAYRRNQGATKGRFIRREVETMQKVEGNPIERKIYRPRGTVTISVNRGRNLLSREFGISGKTSCKVIWDPLRLADEKAKERTKRSDVSSDTPFDIGNTSTIYTADPDWKEMEESAITKRLNQLLPSAKNDFFEASSTNDGVEIRELSFPILQPFRITNKKRGEGQLEAWESSRGAIVLQVKFQDFFNNLPGFDHVLGEVVVPFCELTTEKEIQGWFQILDAGTISSVRLEDHESNEEDLFCGTSLDPPRLHVNLKWNPPTRSVLDTSDDGEREMSYAIQEEMIRSNILFKESKANLVDSSIGAVSKALGIGGTIQDVQNTLGKALDFIEGLINFLNFTDPYKSSLIFVGLLPLLVLFHVIPTRFIILLAGLAQYGMTFFAKYGEDLGITSRKKERKNEGSDIEDKGGKLIPIMVKISNALRSIPTNEDLRRTYFWESRQRGTETAKKYAMEKRESRLKKLWKAKWHSPVKILVKEDKFHWKSIFAVVQGHRFIWWNSVDEFDDGELSSGKVILSGHAGLGGPSPMEVRELDKERELPLCLTIFGRGDRGQERVTVLLPDNDAKQGLEDTIIYSASFKSD